MRSAVKAKRRRGQVKRQSRCGRKHRTCSTVCWRSTRILRPRDRWRVGKQRGLREFDMGRRPLAAAHLDTAARTVPGRCRGRSGQLLRRAERRHDPADPGPAPRWSAQRLDQARDLLPVVLWFARTAAEREPHDFWAVVTVAELVLTAHLLGGPRPRTMSSKPTRKRPPYHPRSTRRSRSGTSCSSTRPSATPRS